MYYIPFLSGVAIILTFAAFYPYIRSIIRGSTKPHVFSWVIWCSTTFVVFLAQLQGHGGMGAWAIGVSGLITLYIAVLAYLKRADISITKLDKLFFTCAISSLPFWYFTEDPMLAVLILTTVDVLGFAPTFRKSFHDPHSESILFFTLFTIRNILVVLALENHNITTVLFPAVIAGVCAVLIIMIVYRRRVLI